MKTLVIGLGSMGKRRIRCLRTLGIADVAGVDLREDRRREAADAYGVRVYADLAEALAAEAPQAAVISLPPKAHVSAMRALVDLGIPFFVEASVVDDGLAQVAADAAKAKLVAAASATLRFHPAIREITRIVRSGQLGKLSNVMLHSGQYLPDWHTYEPVSDYYVSTPETGGAREIVPFEMTWFTDVFGYPRRVAANYRKTIDIAGADYIDDTYNCLLDYGSFLATVTVDVVSRHATRRLLINGSKQQLVWSWDEQAVRVFDGETGAWTSIDYAIDASAPGYNKNIGESMYVDEVAAFLAAVRGEARYPNSLDDDHRVLRLLYACERADRLSTYVEV